MTLQEIEAFLAVVQAGSFSTAAQTLFVTQPTLSRRIESLEGELGCQLFDRGRGRRTAALTDTGQAMVEVAQRWMRLWEETRGVVQTGGKRDVRVGAYQTLCLSVMPIAVSRLAVLQLPQRLELFTLHSGESYTQVEDGEVDLSFIAQPRHSELATTVPLYEEPLVIACAQDAPYEDGMSPRELDATKAIRLEASPDHALWHTYWFGESAHALRTDNLAFATQLLHETGWWVVAPLTMARKLERTEGLRCVRTDNMPPNRTTYLVCRNPTDPLTQTISDQVKAVAEGLMGE